MNNDHYEPMIIIPDMPSSIEKERLKREVLEGLEACAADCRRSKDAARHAARDAAAARARIEALLIELRSALLDDDTSEQSFRAARKPAQKREGLTGLPGKDVRPAPAAQKVREVPTNPRNGEGSWAKYLGGS
jgi:hypothetical protein